MPHFERDSGVFYAIGAYLIWGLLPLFWKQLQFVSAYEIVAHRVIWSFVIVFVWILLRNELSQIVRLIQNKKVILRLIIAALLIGINWALFIWAVNNDHVVDTALGYYINPLLTVLLGVLFFNETLRPGQMVAIFTALCAVGVLLYANGHLPAISLILATTFSLYSLVKKTLMVPATHGMVIETLILMPFGVLYVIYLYNLGDNSFGQSLRVDGMLIAAGLLTLVPLLLFAAAAKRVSMTVLAMSQYLSPSCVFILGVFLYKEAFGWERQVAFGLIWMALLIYTVDQILYGRVKKTKTIKQQQL